MEQYKKVDLNIWVDQKEPYENLFQVGYPVDMHEDFIESKEDKKHNMNNHSKRFRDQIKLNHDKESLTEITKRKVVLANFWMNIGTEINGIRPAIVYKHDDYKFWEDIIVIPITSYEGDKVKSIGALDVELNIDDCEGLHHKSLIKVRQIKSISKKRLRHDKGSWKIKIIGNIMDERIKQQIDTNVRVMFGI